MADNVITPEFRAAFISVFKAIAPLDNPAGEKKYSIRAVFMPGADLTELKKQAQQAVTEKWGSEPPKNLRSPFRRNEELDNPIAGIPDDAIVMMFSSKESYRPGLVDHKRQDIIDESQVYSGAWFRAQVRAYGYEQRGNKGVAFGLQNVQKLRDDDPIGRGVMPASMVFDAVDLPASSSADSLFG